MSISRRTFFAVGTALSALWFAACSTPEPRAVSVAPGVTRVQLGNVTAFTIRDGHIPFTLDANFVRNVPLANVQAALQADGLPTERVDVPYTVLLVETGGQRVLFDAGNDEQRAATVGKLPDGLRAAGIDPKSITAIVFSHFHGDHIGGLRNKAGELVFPSAKIYVPAPEWDWWMDDERMAKAPEAMKAAFAAPRRVLAPLAASIVRFQPGDMVLPGIRSLAAPGHTAGHTVYVVEAGDRKLMYWGDTSNVPNLFVRNPDWAGRFDMDAEAARVMRRKLADMVVDQNMLLAGYHLSGSAIGTLTRRGNGYEFTPLAN
jgi:glyoxylase-like metal-dependent hydrolase (beta-lactamase superfamily II)